LVLIAVIVGACLAAAVSGPAAARVNRDDFMTQPLVPRVLTPVTPTDGSSSGLRLP
jgi:hypothetical protein